MLFANVNGEKVEAIPKTIGNCPLCERSVHSKCGEINVWHWAHHNNESCDSWYEPESEWHKNWKLAFGKDNCEVVIRKEGIRHIADILTNENVVIELQNSPIQKQVIQNREIFYGERMIWVLNGEHFKNNFSIKESQAYADEKHNRDYNPLANQHGSFSKIEIDEFQFTWSHCRKSWSEVQRNVFIDFGDEYLFLVTKGMGTKHGYGKQIEKIKFIKKYGGNIELLETLIDPSIK